mmetsp:Transcript_7728/g.31337  ORF Transcript_7728/g.31337 Transcript_7728/m.31337 type:complete len:442 (-) Transcript_7728:2154-3479(-)
MVRGLERQWLHLPHLLGVFLDRAIRRKLPHGTSRANGPRRPRGLVQVRRVRHVECIEVPGKIVRYEVVVVRRFDVVHELREIVGVAENAGPDHANGPLQPLVVYGQAALHGVPERRHLIRGGAEAEEVILAHRARDFDVRAIRGSDDESTVHDEFHVSGARRLHARCGYVLAHVGRRDDQLREGHVKVGNEHDLQDTRAPHVVVHSLAHGASELDDLLGDFVPRCRFPGDDADAGQHPRPLLGGRPGDDRIPVHYSEHVQQLPLVLVYALHLHVVYGVGHEVHTHVGLDPQRKPLLVQPLGLVPRVLKGVVVREGLERREPAKVVDPPGTEDAGKYPRHRGVRLQDPPPRRHAVGHVFNPPREHLVKLGEQPGLHQPGVNLRDTVDDVRAHHSEVRHPDHLRRRLLNDGHRAHLLVVARPSILNLLQEPVVDLVDDLHVAG